MKFWKTKMAESTGVVGRGSVYQRWIEASPKLTFPFSSPRRRGPDGGPPIKYTWKDVREAYLEDGVSTTLHRSTAHMTPTNIQSQIIKDEIKRDHRFLRQRDEAPSSARTTSIPKLPQSAMLVPSPPQTARRPAPPPILAEHGRAAYLESQRRLPFLKDLPANCIASSRAYGFAARNRIVVHATAEHHRRVTGLRDAYRPNGVFPSTK